MNLINLNHVFKHFQVKVDHLNIYIRAYMYIYIYMRIYISYYIIYKIVIIKKYTHVLLKI